LISATTFEAFERYLESAIDRIEGTSPIRGLVRDHFALDDPSAKRGKRLRPRILVTTAEAEGADVEAAFPAAAAVELLHNFSLVHDDIEDRDEMRHGRPTLWVKHGIPAALNAGDAMCAASYEALFHGARDRDPVLLAAMTTSLFRAHHHMCEGQSYDIGFETATSVSFAEYVTMIEGKTAALFAASCELGALAAGAQPERAQAYGALGRAYGLAFQVRDDILGTWGATELTGKPSGADIRNRKWSFPVAWAMDGPPSADRETVAQAYGKLEALDDAQAERVIAALGRLGAQHAADEACETYIAEARRTATTHALDRDGHLVAIFEATANRMI
jgi:geranylgeranyl diphosphate synthase type I